MKEFEAFDEVSEIVRQIDIVEGDIKHRIEVRKYLSQSAPKQYGGGIFSTPAQSEQKPSVYATGSYETSPENVIKVLLLHRQRP